MFSLIVLVPVGFWMMMQMGCANTLIQAMVPDRLRGTHDVALFDDVHGMAPLGSLLGGVAANWIGAPWTLAIGGIIGIAGAGWFYLQLPSLNAEADRLIVAQGMAGGSLPNNMRTSPPIALAVVVRAATAAFRRALHALPHPQRA